MRYSVLLSRPLNEPVTSSDSDLAFLKSFTEQVVSKAIYPRMRPGNVVVLQPGPGNDKVLAYQTYDFPTNVSFIFDIHAYICFSWPLYLTTMDDVIAHVCNLLSSSHEHR